MSERGRILASSIVIMVIVSVCVATAAIVVLNHVSFEQQRDRLLQVVQHRARILEEVASFDAPLSAKQSFASSRSGQTGADPRGIREVRNVR